MFGILNCLYHHWSDWEIALLTSKIKGYELDQLYYSKQVIFSSLYGPIFTDNPSVVQALILIIISGYSISNFILKLYQKQKFLTWLLLSILFWVLKFPLTIDLSTYQGIYRGLLAW